MNIETPLLDKITEARDIRDLSPEDLETLCLELRDDLINRVNQVGGHFASSLGVTELTVALHYCFNTPDDRLVWDVGHQAYIHKILTGRRAEMLIVRTKGGISGFPRREESQYDTFGVAHAGTSISAALGMCEGHHLSHDTEKRSVAVIGDGAMTAGMAFEALNHSGHLHRKLIVVLNDNEISIAPNVGALSLAFSKAITAKLSTAARRHFKSLTTKGLIPKTFYRALDKAEEATQGFFSSPAMLFSWFGHRYIGPIDGHNIPQLLDAFERAKEQDGPVLVHVLTTKGKGYLPAEDDPVRYHAISANQLSPKNESTTENQSQASNKTATLPKTYTQVFGETMVEICKENPKVVGITAAMPDGTGLTQLSKEVPEQFYDVGIAEQHAVTFAAGLACEGIIPVCAIYSTFLQRAYDQVIHDVCIQKLPVIFAMDRGGLVGSDGPTHHGAFDLSFLRLIPEMTIMAPRDEAELKQMLTFAVSLCEQGGAGPIAIRYPRGNGVGTEDLSSRSPITIGQAEHQSIVAAGDVAILTVGNTFEAAETSAIKLQEEGVTAHTYNMRFIKPIDEALVSSIAKNYKYIITVEDNAATGGFGSAVIEYLCKHNLHTGVRISTLGLPDNFVEHGTQKELYSLVGIDAAGIYEEACNLLNASHEMNSSVSNKLLA